MTASRSSEPALRMRADVGDLTGGSYYRAENADQLLEVFLSLPRASSHCTSRPWS